MLISTALKLDLVKMKVEWKVLEFLGNNKISLKKELAHFFLMLNSVAKLLKVTFRLFNSKNRKKLCWSKPDNLKWRSLHLLHINLNKEITSKIGIYQIIIIFRNNVLVVQLLLEELLNNFSPKGPEKVEVFKVLNRNSMDQRTPQLKENKKNHPPNLYLTNNLRKIIKIQTKWIPWTTNQPLQEIQPESMQLLKSTNRWITWRHRQWVQKNLENN